MLFNSFSFVVFFFLFFCLWQWLKRKNTTRWVFLTVSSLFFYAWWDGRFIFLIIFSGLIDFFAGIFMHRYPAYKKYCLLISIAGNLGSLAVFKYSAFFASVIDDLMHVAGLHTSLESHIPDFFLILPVGISFYTFQSMSYTIDIYRGRLQPVRNVFLFFAYLSMFPQLVAGPIIRARDLLQQLCHNRKVSGQQAWHGVRLLASGFFQKTVLADHISVMVNHYFDHYTLYSGALEWWLAVIGFAFQIYFDFSGYSLIARGLAKLMGYHFKMNFNHPYLAASLKNFWQRWHISLSTWFRDYVYIPLGGSRKGKWASIGFMFVTMLLSGLWHGAAFTFIVWGAVHACMLAAERLLKNSLLFSMRWVHYLITLFLVMIAWVFFRAPTVHIALYVLEKMLSFRGGSFPFETFFPSYIFLLLAVFSEWGYHIQKHYKLPGKVSRHVVFEIVQISVMILMVLFVRGPEQKFIYFQF